MTTSPDGWKFGRRVVTWKKKPCSTSENGSCPQSSGPKVTEMLALDFWISIWECNMISNRLVFLISTPNDEKTSLRRSVVTIHENMFFSCELSPHHKKEFCSSPVHKHPAPLISMLVKRWWTHFHLKNCAHHESIMSTPSSPTFRERKVLLQHPNMDLVKYSSWETFRCLGDNI